MTARTRKKEIVKTSVESAIHHVLSNVEGRTCILEHDDVAARASSFEPTVRRRRDRFVVVRSDVRSTIVLLDLLDDACRRTAYVQDTRPRNFE